MRTLPLIAAFSVDGLGLSIVMQAYKDVLGWGGNHMIVCFSFLSCFMGESVSNMQCKDAVFYHYPTINGAFYDSFGQKSLMEPLYFCYLAQMYHFFAEL